MNKENFDEVNELTVVKSIKEITPPLSETEKKQLEENILKDKEIRDPIVCFKNENKFHQSIFEGYDKNEQIILDGHNRYDIAQKHNIPFRKIEKSLQSKDEVIEWIVKNQMGRRNLSSYARVSLALKLKPVLESEARKKSWGNLQQNQENKSDPQILGDREKNEIKEEKRKNTHENETNAKIAKMADVSAETVRKVEEINKNDNEDIIDKLKTNELSISRAYKLVKSKNAGCEEKQLVNNSLEESSVNTPLIIQNSIIDSVPKKIYKLLITIPPNEEHKNDLSDFVEKWMTNAFKKLDSNGRAYVVINNIEELSVYLQRKNIFGSFEFHQMLVLKLKDCSKDSEHIYSCNYKICLLYCNKNPSTDINVQSEKDKQAIILGSNIIEIAENFIKHSTNKGDMVFDPFAGEGKFIISATKLGRQAFGFESDNEKIDIAVQKGCERYDNKESEEEF